MFWQSSGLDAVPHIKYAAHPRKTVHTHPSILLIGVISCWCLCRFWREVPALMQDFLSFLVKIVGTVLNTLAAAVRQVMRRAGMQPPDVAFPTRYGYASV